MLTRSNQWCLNRSSLLALDRVWSIFRVVNQLQILHIFTFHLGEKSNVFSIWIVEQNVYHISIQWAKICVPRADMAIRDDTNFLSGDGESYKLHPIWTAYTFLRGSFL